MGWGRETGIEDFVLSSVLVAFQAEASSVCFPSYRTKGKPGPSAQQLEHEGGPTGPQCSQKLLESAQLYLKKNFFFNSASKALQISHC